MTWQLFQWITTGASICGVVLNIRKSRYCFWVWAGTNASWAVIDALSGLWSQASLFTVYFGLAIWGIVAWRKKP